MRIVAVVGIWNFRRAYASLWKHFEIGFREQFPNAAFTVEHLWYSPWQAKKMRTFTEALVEKNDTGEDIILVGYSLGGVIACAAAPRFKRSKILAIATVYSPHTFLWNCFSRMLGADLQNEPVAPLVSFGASWDGVVLWGARHPHALKHQVLPSDHVLCLLLSKKPAEVVARTLKEIVCPEEA